MYLVMVLCIMSQVLSNVHPPGPSCVTHLTLPSFTAQPMSSSTGSFTSPALNQPFLLGEMETNRKNMGSKDSALNSNSGTNSCKTSGQ